MLARRLCAKECGAKDVKGGVVRHECTIGLEMRLMSDSRNTAYEGGRAMFQYVHMQSSPTSIKIAFPAGMLEAS